VEEVKLSPRRVLLVSGTARSFKHILHVRILHDLKEKDVTLEAGLDRHAQGLNL
jgi:hypothetical protein